MTVWLALVSCTHTYDRTGESTGKARPGTNATENAIQPWVGYEAHFLLTWNGSRIGDASESLRRHGAGLRFERREHVSMRRGDALVHSETVIAITTDQALVARDVTIRQVSDDSLVQGHAHRDKGGRWLARYGDEKERSLPDNAVPAELVPILIAASSPGAGFRGRVILAGYGFASAELEVSFENERTAVATLHTPHGAVRGEWRLTRHGTLAQVLGHDGVGAVRVAAEDLLAAFDPPDVVASVSIPVRNVGVSESPGSAEKDMQLVIEPVLRAQPPPLPGQRVEVHDRTWRVWLEYGDMASSTADALTAEHEREAPDGDTPDGGDAPDPRVAELARRIVQAAHAQSTRAEVMALARATAELIEDDLGSPGTSARAALALGRGDCTTHATLFAALARTRHIPVRLVTGYRLDAGRLVRHRWAIARVDGMWMAVDPTYGEAPALPRLLGLAVHDDSTADMAMVDDVAFAGFGSARAWR